MKPSPEAQSVHLPKTVYKAPNVPFASEGDPDMGLRYLIYGDYIGSGFPARFYEQSMKSYRDTVLQRDGNNAKIPYTNNYFATANGVDVVSGNCFTCHGGPYTDGHFLGLGNSFADFSKSRKSTLRFAKSLSKVLLKKKSPERAAFNDAYRYYWEIAPHIVPANRGVNPAFRLEEACVSVRNPEDLTYSETPQFSMSRFNVASDIPPLWNVKKKRALYYNGMGRGALTKLLMQAIVLGVEDSTAAREVEQKFEDVAAWVLSLEPPQYPFEIDSSLLAEGLAVFEEHCQKCHGTYGAFPQYPNKIIPMDRIGTDSLYARYFLTESHLTDWYNASWFGQASPQSELRPSYGYVAPPLDGIWATAPFLHNGSVPDLQSLLNSPERPTYWLRDFDGKAYDPVRVGWAYEVKKSGGKHDTYDTTQPGYGNQGHTFGDKLTEAERKAVIEYLKTL
ncbi:hypothetical protein [Pontibacter sp. G13]|uniref:c-type cytochrome n=1 Tax=Pontibacter sp. G13 TaxID=3074898 RepID=UPI00288B56B4|nr:hypothetical protein [Pontibacter sp. G13]WNJ20846.1 hypothetical protein RJD25_10215 [Pontibacter sp. G13]